MSARKRKQRQNRAERLSYAMLGSYLISMADYGDIRRYARYFYK